MEVLTHPAVPWVILLIFFVVVFISRRERKRKGRFIIQNTKMSFIEVVLKIKGENIKEYKLTPYDDDTEYPFIDFDHIMPGAIVVLLHPGDEGFSLLSCRDFSEKEKKEAYLFIQNNIWSPYKKQIENIERLL